MGLFESLDARAFALAKPSGREDPRDKAEVTAFGQEINRAMEAQRITWEQWQKLYNLISFGRDWNTDRNAA